MPTRVEVVADRIAAMKLTDTISKLSPQATISPTTLVEAGALDVTALGKLDAFSTADLPRITVDRRLVDEDLPTNGITTADLEVRRVLGEGGMGRVLLAYQRSLNREIAIKALKPGDNSPVLAGALLREARVTGALEHPGIVPVHALGLDESGLPLLVMKRIEGVSLQVLLDDSTHSAWQTLLSGATDRLEASLRILMRVCESLAFAHSRGVVHCDIKPENIMVGAYGEVVLCDWGVALRLNELAGAESAFVGTPAYMAPEMLLGQTLDARTDVYLLGATLHHVLTGKARHVGPSMQQIMNSIMDSSAFAYAEDIPLELAELCNRATAQDPAVRPASAEAFRQEIAEHLRKRSARVLCDAALERLSLLESMLASSAEKGGDPKDLGAMYRHAAEARFGYGYALRIEPKLETAQSGLEQTLRALFDLELRQQHIDSAAALLDEMQKPSEELRSRLDLARQEMERQRAETERLRVMAHELDPRVEARWRGIGIASMVLATFITIVALMHGTDFGKVTNADLTLFASLLSLSCISTFWLLRRRLLATIFNRRIAALLGITCAFILLHRALAWYEAQPVELVLREDMLTLAALMSVGTVLIEKRMSSVVLALLGLRAFMTFFPHYSAEIFTAAGLVTLALMLWAWRAPKDRASTAKDSA